MPPPLEEQMIAVAQGDGDLNDAQDLAPIEAEVEHCPIEEPNQQEQLVIADNEQIDEVCEFSEDSFDSDDFAESEVSPVKSFSVAYTNQFGETRSQLTNSVGAN